MAGTVSSGPSSGQVERNLLSPGGAATPCEQRDVLFRRRYAAGRPSGRSLTRLQDDEHERLTDGSAEKSRLSTRLLVSPHFITHFSAALPLSISLPLCQFPYNSTSKQYPALFVQQGTTITYLVFQLPKAYQRFSSRAH